MNRMKLGHRSAAALSIAAALTMASGLACANPLNFGTTLFYNHDGIASIAATDPVTGLAWVSPNVAAHETASGISDQCSTSTGVCTGSLSGLTWASDTEVEQFWKDIGIPMNTALGVPVDTQSYSSIGKNDLGGLIDILGPTQVTGGGKNFLGWQNDFTDYLGGIRLSP